MLREAAHFFGGPLVPSTTHSVLRQLTRFCGNSRGAELKTHKVRGRLPLTSEMLSLWRAALGSNTAISTLAWVVLTTPLSIIACASDGSGGGADTGAGGIRNGAGGALCNT